MNCTLPSLKEIIFLNNERFLNWEPNFLNIKFHPKQKKFTKKISEKWIFKFKIGLENNVCVFCNGDIETTEHFFISCSHTQVLWEQFMEWLSRKIPVMPVTDHKNILFGMSSADKQLDLMINVLIILAIFFKFHPASHITIMKFNFIWSPLN